MRKQIALAMKDHYLNYYKHYDGYRLEELDLKKRGCEKEGHIKFMFDRSTSVLTITGDYGFAVFSWWSNQNTLETIRDYIKDKPWYFEEKCLATSRSRFVYDHDKAIRDIRSWLRNFDIPESEWGDIFGDLSSYDSPDEFVSKLANCVDYTDGFDFSNGDPFGDEDTDLKNAVKEIDNQWEYSTYDFGKIVAPIFEVWAHALDVGMKWKERQEKE